MRMTIKVEIIEANNGNIEGRTAVGIDTNNPLGDPPTHALIDHMFRKMDQEIATARLQLEKKCILQQHIQ